MNAPLLTPLPSLSRTHRQARKEAYLRYCRNAENRQREAAGLPPLPSPRAGDGFDPAQLAASSEVHSEDACVPPSNGSKGLAAEPSVAAAEAGAAGLPPLQTEAAAAAAGAGGGAGKQRGGWLCFKGGARQNHGGLGAFKQPSRFRYASRLLSMHQISEDAAYGQHVAHIVSCLLGA